MKVSVGSSLVTLIILSQLSSIWTAAEELTSQLVYLHKCSQSLHTSSPDELRVPANLVYSQENTTFGLREARKLKSWCTTTSTLQYTLEIVPTVNPGKIPDHSILTESDYTDQITNVTSSVDVNMTNFESEDYYEEEPPMQKYFMTNGFLRIDRDYYRPSEFCIKGINASREILVEVCQPRCNSTSKYTRCVRKCCSLGKSLNVLKTSCTPTGPKEWTPFFYRNPYTILKASEQKKFKPHLSQSPPSCKLEHSLHNRQTANETKQPWRLLQDGTIWYIAGNRKWTKLATDNYCIDGLVDYGEGEFYTGLPSDQGLLICPEEDNSTTGKYSPLYVTVMLISAVFLLLTAIVYVLLWDRQSNIHTWTVLSQVISMFFLYIFLATANIMSLYIGSEDSGTFCKLIGILAHYFFLSTFCWLTMINFDLCWTFRTLSPGVGRSKGIRRFLCYCAFAFSLPISVITTGLVLEHIYADDLESEVVTPLYGQLTCYIAVWAQGVYVYYIVGTLISCNFILILITVFTVFKLRQITGMVDNSNSRSNSQHQSLKLFAKLFVIMGVTWVFEIISWSSTLSDPDKTHWYWVLFDLINILQAIAIFIIFVCKPRTLNQLQQKYPCLKRIFTPILAKFNTPQQSRDVAVGEAEFEHQTTGSSVASSKQYNNKRYSDTKL